MGIPVLIYGKSGSGKSRSLKNFAEDEIFLINVERKPLPFRKKFMYVMDTPGKCDNLNYIIMQLKKMPCKAAVVDDAGYLMTHLFMDNHKSKKGNASFEMYDAIADTMYQLVKQIKDELDDDKIVYLMMHEDTDDFGATKLRTIGKLIDNKVCLEGMVTICIRCMSDNGKHFFRVQTNGLDITKTPEDMFDTPEVENDLKLIDTAIRDYYELNKEDNKNDQKME